MPGGWIGGLLPLLLLAGSGRRTVRCVGRSPKPAGLRAAILVLLLLVLGGEDDEADTVVDEDEAEGPERAVGCRCLNDLRSVSSALCTLCSDTLTADSDVTRLMFPLRMKLTDARAASISSASE